MIVLIISWLSRTGQLSSSHHKTKLITQKLETRFPNYQFITVQIIPLSRKRAIYNYHFSFYNIIKVFRKHHPPTCCVISVQVATCCGQNRQQSFSWWWRLVSVRVMSVCLKIFPPWIPRCAVTWKMSWTAKWSVSASWSMEIRCVRWQRISNQYPVDVLVFNNNCLLGFLFNSSFFTTSASLSVSLTQQQS